jgi:hypothetical protein
LVPTGNAPEGAEELPAGTDASPCSAADSSLLSSTIGFDILLPARFLPVLEGFALAVADLAAGTRFFGLLSVGLSSSLLVSSLESGWSNLLFLPRFPCLPEKVYIHENG